MCQSTPAGKGRRVTFNAKRVPFVRPLLDDFPSAARNLRRDEGSGHVGIQVTAVIKSSFTNITSRATVAVIFLDTRLVTSTM